MDDERKKPPLKRGPKAGGGKSGGPRNGERTKTGKAAYNKPFRSGDKKPFAKRRDAETTGGDRPKRDFRRDDRPQDAGERKPQGQERKPFTKHAEGERGARRFERGEGNDGGHRGERPYRSEPRPGGKPRFERRDERASGEAGPRRPYREERGDDVRQRGERPFRSESKPFERRPEGNARPGRRERDEMSGDERARRVERPSRERPKSGRKPFARAPGGPEAEEAAPGERIAKRLARAGIASRRDAEDLIAAGRIRVNGKVLTSPAFNVTPDDTIELDGTLIPPIERTRLFLFHKPAGLVTTNRDPEGRRTVFDVLPKDLPRLMTVGRLDINTEGLLLLTNDGGLARVLELPATGWLRRYRVRVHGKVDEKALADLKGGIAVDGVFYGSVEASLEREQGTNAWLNIGLREGKNREVKNILGALGLDVTRLIRISYGPFQLGELPEGAVQELKGKMLRDQLGERLIEEAGANFEAPISKPFSNKPVRAERDERPPSSRVARDSTLGTVGEGGLIKARKRRENSRDEALSRLSTRPDHDERTGPRAKPGAKRFGEREQRSIEPPGGRKANVWMAPGARPQGKGRLEAEAAKAKAGKERKAGSKPFAKQRPEGGKGGARPDADRRR
jgi:23S rRNA pseudouridine2605 synthase